MDHPRLCGEKHEICVCRCFWAGSPPPMRGKVVRYVHRTPKRRITPAYAGKSFRATQKDRTAGDHPRLCGEKLFHVRFLRCKRGSPPPMRGKANFRRRLQMCRGITPAYAGKRISRGFCIFCLWDHPRLCGEKLSIHAASLVHFGSPPPMRGKEMSGMSDVSANGITPAYAGKSGFIKST